MVAKPRQKLVASHVDKLAILRNHPLFSALEPDLLARLGSYAIPRRVKRGKRVFARGDTGTSLFALCSGTIKISTPSARGRGAMFNLIPAGAIFGEIAVLDGLPRTADAMAMTDCELLAIERRDFLSLIRERPEFSLKLIEVLCRRLRQTTEHLEDMMFLDLRSRLAKALLQRYEDVKSTSGRSKIALTQRNLGEMIGMSRESTNKQLRVWERQNVIAIERGGIVILAPDKLEVIASTSNAISES